MSEAEVDRIVSTIDGNARDLFSVADVDDGPKTRTFGKRVREDSRITRAKSRIRMAAWRKANALAKRPTGDQIVRSMLKALLTSSTDDLRDSDKTLIIRALQDLQGRGYDLHAAKSYLRRMRDEIVPPADRAGEPSTDTIF